MAKRLIVNGDDFGFSPGVNAAILRAHREGILTSATLAANMPAAAAAAAAARESPSLGVGVHLNVVRGRPLSPPSSVPRLLDISGRFRLRHAGLARLHLRPDPVLLGEIETEYRAQIERVLSWGLRPTHLDSERHHAAWPRLLALAARLAEEYGIPALRLPREPFWPGEPRARFRDEAAALFLRFLLWKSGRLLERHRLRAPAWCYGIRQIGRIAPRYFERLAPLLPEGTHELMLHPGLPGVDSAPEAASYLDESREREFRALTDPASRAALCRAGVELVDYRALTGPGT